MNRSHLFLAFIILVYLVNGIIAIPTLSITADEGSHLSYGIRMLKGNPERIDPEKDNSKMPISVINALPRAVEQLITFPFINRTMVSGISSVAGILPCFSLY